MVKSCKQNLFKNVKRIMPQVFLVPYCLYFLYKFELGPLAFSDSEFDF
jgi:hypothetical protein